MERGRLNNVQVARGLAALSVAIGHSLGQFINHPIAGMHQVSTPLGAVWGNGVDVFFVISGFIMYYMTHDRFNREGYALEFIKRRILRVAPIYWVFTTLMLLMILVAPSAVNSNVVGLQYALSSYLFIPEMRADGQYHPLFGLGWTLNYEFFFYTAFAVALIAPVRRGLPALIAFFVLLAIVHPRMPEGPLQFWSEPIILEFIAGIGLAALFIRGVRLSFATALIGMVASVALAIALNRGFPDAERLLRSGLPSILLSAALILSPERRWPSGIVLIGDASYSLYLSHPFLLNAVTAGWRVLGLPLDGYSYLLVLITGSVGFGVIVYRWLETPLVFYLRRQFEPRREVLATS